MSLLALPFLFQAMEKNTFLNVACSGALHGAPVLRAALNVGMTSRALYPASIAGRRVLQAGVYFRIYGSTIEHQLDYSNVMNNDAKLTLQHFLRKNALLFKCIISTVRYNTKQNKL